MVSVSIGRLAVSGLTLDREYTEITNNQMQLMTLNCQLNKDVRSINGLSRLRPAFTTYIQEGSQNKVYEIMIAVPTVREVDVVPVSTAYAISRYIIIPRKDGARDRMQVERSYLDIYGEALRTSVVAECSGPLTFSIVPEYPDENDDDTILPLAFLIKIKIGQANEYEINLNQRLIITAEGLRE